MYRWPNQCAPALLPSLSAASSTKTRGLETGPAARAAPSAEACAWALAIVLLQYFANNASRLEGCVPQVVQALLRAGVGGAEVPAAAAPAGRAKPCRYRLLIARPL